MKKIFFVLVLMIGILNFSLSCYLESLSQTLSGKNFSKSEIEKIENISSERIQYMSDLFENYCTKKGGHISKICPTAYVVPNCYDKNKKQINFEDSNIEKVAYEKFPKINEELKLEKFENKNFVEIGPALYPISIQNELLKFLPQVFGAILVGILIIYIINKKSKK